jgi:hypothetical protein
LVKCLQAQKKGKEMLSKEEKKAIEILKNLKNN